MYNGRRRKFVQHQRCQTLPGKQINIRQILITMLNKAVLALASAAINASRTSAPTRTRVDQLPALTRREYFPDYRKTGNCLFQHACAQSTPASMAAATSVPARLQNSTGRQSAVSLRKPCQAYCYKRHLLVLRLRFASKLKHIFAVYLLKPDRLEGKLPAAKSRLRFSST